MAPLDAVIVGFREHDRRRLRIAAEYGVAYVRVRNCAADCGYPVYFNASALEKLGQGAEVVCQDCADRYMPEIRDAL